MNSRGRREFSRAESGRASQTHHAGQQVGLCGQGEKGFLMAVVNPLPKEHAAADVHAVYDNLLQAFGRMPNVFAVMAHRPWVLNAFRSTLRLSTRGRSSPNTKNSPG